MNQTKNPFSSGWGVLTILLVLSGSWLISAPLAGPEGQVDSLYRSHRYAEAIQVGLELLKKGGNRTKLSSSIVHSYLALEKYLELGELLCDGKLDCTDPSVFNRVAMSLQTGNARMLKAGVCCAEHTARLSPENVTYAYNMGLLYWNNGQVDQARTWCEKVIKMDPGNVQATQILERIAKQNIYHSGAKETRSVTFRAVLPAGEPAYLSGSWSKEGLHSHLLGYKKEPMIQKSAAGGSVTWELTKVLHTESGPWYVALLSTSPERFSEAKGFVRFPLYPFQDKDMTVSFEGNPIHEARGILRPRPPNPGSKNPDPRVYMICIDSATWNTFMPLIQGGRMPNMAKLIARGTSLILHSDPPVSTVAFDIFNFGTVRGFGIMDVLAGGIGILKERGINLLTYGDIQGKDHTWKYLAKLGIPCLYASWAEQLYCAKGGAETAHNLDLDPNDVPVAGEKPRNDIEKVASFLSREDAAALTSLSLSDKLISNLYDEGVKKFYQGLKLTQDTKARVILAHVGFVDVSYHTFWDSMESELLYSGSNVDHKVDRRYRFAIDGMHLLTDLMVGDLLAEFDLAKDTLIIFSDHGATGGFAKTYYGHDPKAILVAAGPEIKTDRIEAKQMEVLDLVPTLCHILKVKPPPGYPGTIYAPLFLTPPGSVAHTGKAPAPASSPR